MKGIKLLGMIFKIFSLVATYGALFGIIFECFGIIANAFKECADKLAPHLNKISSDNKES